MSEIAPAQELSWPFPEHEADGIELRLHEVIDTIQAMTTQVDLPDIVLHIIDAVLHQPRKLLASPLMSGKHLTRSDGGLWPLHTLLMHAAIAQCDTPDTPCAAWEMCIPVAASMEFLGAALDIFDDVQDNDGTLLETYGVPMLINAAMTFREMAAHALTDKRIPRPLQSVLQETCASDTLRAIGGQTLDIAFEQQTRVSVEDAIDMTERKSGSLVGLVYRLGALVALYGRYHADRLRAVSDNFAAFGRTLGVTLQLENDWVDAQDDARKSDRQRRKKTLPLVVEAEHMPSGLRDDEQAEHVLRVVETMINLYRRRAKAQLAALVSRYHLSPRWLHWVVSA